MLKAAATTKIPNGHKRKTNNKLMNRPNICITIDFHLRAPAEQFIFVLFLLISGSDQAITVVILFGRLCDLQILFQ